MDMTCYIQVPNKVPMMHEKAHVILSSLGHEFGGSLIQSHLALSPALSPESGESARSGLAKAPELGESARSGLAKAPVLAKAPGLFFT